MNNVTLLGRLTADIELKESSNGKEFANFNLAVDNYYGNDNVDFIRCVAFGKTAVALANNCGKGRQLLVEGSLRVTNHNRQTYYSVATNRLTFLHNPKASATPDTKKATTKKATTKKAASKAPKEEPIKEEDLPF